MPRYEGVYQDSKGGWYYKAWSGYDPLTAKKNQTTQRGFATAADAARARKAYLADVDAGRRPAAAARTGMSVNELMDWYLDGLDADDRLSGKTRFDYRVNTNSYIRPWLGPKNVRDVTPELIIKWQRKLVAEGGRKKGQPLSPNTVRLARAPLAGAFKAAVATGLMSHNPLPQVPRPTARRSIPRHWSPEEARAFLAAEEGDRLWPLWAFLLGSGLRIGELVWLRWPNVELDRKVVRIREFASPHGYELKPSIGKSRDAVRSIDLDDMLVSVLRLQRKHQTQEQLAAEDYAETDYVFTRLRGGSYHPQTISQGLARRSEVHGLPRLTAHGLRHTSATLMLANGVPPKVAGERLGHADATLFMNLYSHVTPSMQQDAAVKISGALFGSAHGG
ncbi:MAG: tyrosine-type recombinase/integrase [Acidimicrobiales bacterium]